MKSKKYNSLPAHWLAWTIRVLIALIPLVITTFSVIIVLPIYFCSGIKKYAKEL